VQREELPSESDRSAEGLPFVSSGRVRLNWHNGPPPLPTPGPVIGGFDLLHGEPIIDEKSTRQLELSVDEVNRRGLPVISKAEHFRRQLEYLWKFAPEQCESYIADHPSEALSPADLPDPVSPSPVQSPVVKGAADEAAPKDPPEGAMPEDPALEPGPAAADPAELDTLLAAEEAAEAAGDQEKLAQVREQIDNALK